MRKIAAIFCCICLVTFLGSGCKQAANKPDSQPGAQVQQTDDAEKRIMASRFSNLATEVSGVQKATVVVSSTEAAVPGQAANMAGKMIAMVGLTLDSQVSKDMNKVQSIQEEIKTKIMSNDQRISEVLITTNPDMIKKLQDVAAGVIQGKPVQSYAQDINELNKGIRAQ